MPPAVKQPAQPKQSVVTVTMKDGSVHEYTIDPLSIYKATSAGHTGAIPVTYAATWFSAGEPLGNFEKWLGTTLYITEDIVDVPLANGKPR